MTFDILRWASQHPWTTSLILVTSVLILWAWSVNHVMKQTPPEILKNSPSVPWTHEKIQEAYRHAEKNPVDWDAHLPSKLDRRYIIVGGSGLVGGYIAVQLIRQGHSPHAVRIVDARPPYRDDMISGPIAQVSFQSADMTSESSTKAAFSAPWDASVANLPLTVFHCAAIMRPGERRPQFYPRSYEPNVLGTANILSAAKEAKASLFIYTSSCSIAYEKLTWFLNAPWNWPKGFIQTITEDDFFEPYPSDPANFFSSNYARSKAEAERLVCEADSPSSGFRTGAIRPGNGIYGHRDDMLVGLSCRSGSFPTFTAPWIESWVHGGNVALAHLQLEKAILGPYVDKSKIAGRPFLVTDPGEAPRFEDTYEALRVLSETPITVSYPPPVVLLGVAHGIEFYIRLLTRLPFLKKLGLEEPGKPTSFMQPAIYSSSVNLLIVDSPAKRGVDEGGFGYNPACTTLEGVCGQIVEWNRYIKSQKAEGKATEDLVRTSEKGVVKDFLEVGPDPPARQA